QDLSGRAVPDRTGGRGAGRCARMAIARPLAQELDRQAAARWSGQPAPALADGPRALWRLALSAPRDGQLPADRPVQHTDIAIAAGSGPWCRDPRPELLVRRSIAIADARAASRRHAAVVA